MEQIMNYIKPELMGLVLVLYFVGVAFKKAAFIAGKYIPLLLGLCGVILASLYVVALSDIVTYKDAFMAVATALVQGILCAGCSVYVNQIIKQAGKKE